jgi:hypothetical protein
MRHSKLNLAATVFVTVAFIAVFGTGTVAKAAGVGVPSMDPETFKSACERAGGTFSAGSKKSICTSTRGTIVCDNSNWTCGGSC